MPVLLTLWTPSPGALVGCLVLAAGYALGLRRVHRAGGRWPRGRTVAWSCGVLLLALTGTSCVAVLGATLFWAGAVQGVVLLVVAPVLLAGGAPLTLVRDTVPTWLRHRLGRVRCSAAARWVTLPPVVTVLLVAPPFVLYLTGLYAATTIHEPVAAAVSVVLLICGFVYAASRLQIDPLPRRTHHGITLLIALVEILADGVLGLVLWLGPLVVTDHQAAGERLTGLDPRTDQVIGAGVWWLGGDVAGLPFLLAIMTRFASEDDERARTEDAASRPRTDPHRPGGPGDEDERQAARARALWWQDDPYLAQRFHRR